MIEILNELSTNWFEFVFPRLMDFTIVFTLVGILWLVIRHKASCQFGYCLFLLALVKLVLPGMFSMPLISTPQIPQQKVEYSGDILGWQYSDSNERTKPATLHPSKMDNSIPELEANKTAISIPISVVLFSVYCTVVLILSIRFCWFFYQSSRKVRQSNTVSFNSFPVDLEKLKEKATIRRGVEWRTAAWVKSPFVFGIFRPKILLPADIQFNFTPSQLRWILLHELAHIKRWDGLFVLLQHIIQIVFFFHPFVWWSNKIIEEMREFACDDFALAVSKSSHKDCGEGFLGIVFESNNLPQLLPATLGLTNYKIVVRRRLMRITDKTRTLQKRLSLQSVMYLLVIALLIVPLSLQNAFAQMGGWKSIVPMSVIPAQVAQEVIFTDSGQRLGESFSNEVDLGDIDGDGDLDAFIANASFPGQPDKVWLNDGDGFFTDSGQIIEGTESSNVVLEDIDKDGDLDAVVAVGDGSNRVYLNDGSGIFTDSGQRLGNQESHSLALGDLDEDGDLDIFFANTFGQNSNNVFLNDGKGTFIETGQRLGSSNSQGISLGDLDSDGDLDAFVANFDNQPNTVWLNDGNGMFTDSGQRMGNATSREVALGDLDGDGDPDAYIANTADFFSSPRAIGQNNAVWLNDGNGIFTNTKQRLGVVRSEGVAYADFDGDGDLDAFIINENTENPAPNEIWLNDGSGNFSDSGLKMGVRDSRGLALGDIDNDGDLDAFIANSFNEANWVWFNDSEPTSIFGWTYY